MKNKHFSIILILTFILSILTASTASASTKGNHESISHLSKVFHLKTISADQVPKGVIPVEFSSVEDAEKALEEVSAIMNLIVTDNSTILPVTSKETNGKSASAYNYDYQTNLTTITIHLAGTLYYKNNRFTGNHSVPSTWISGVTLGFGWTQTGTPYVTYNEAMTRADSYASGTLDYYLIINGVIKVFSQNYNLTGYSYFN